MEPDELAGVDGVNSTGHTDDLAIFRDCHRKMVPRVSQKLLGELGVDRAVEDVRRQVLQYRVLGRAEDSDGDHGGVLSLMQAVVKPSRSSALEHSWCVLAA
jgi:hypothetical protein